MMRSVLLYTQSWVSLAYMIKATGGISQSAVVVACAILDSPLGEQQRSTTRTVRMHCQGRSRGNATVIRSVWGRCGVRFQGGEAFGASVACVLVDDSVCVAMLLLSGDFSRSAQCASP